MKIILFLLLLFTAFFSDSISSQNNKYDTCSAKFSCGDQEDIGYPFYNGSSTRPDYCGYPGFKLDCSPGIPPIITISGQEYYIKNTNDDDKYAVTVSRNDTWAGRCPEHLTNTTMDFYKFNFSPASQNIIFFYGCQAELSTLKTTCNLGGYGSLGGYYLTPKMVVKYESLNLFKNCFSNVFLPVPESKAEDIDKDPGNLGILIAAFEAGFDLDLIAENAACSWCMDSDGVCGYDSDSSKCVL